MAKKANKNSAKARRRGKGPNYIQLFRYVMDCPAYVSLSAKARAALIEVTRGYNGSNNGMIVLSVRQLAERMACDPYTAALALRELVEKGFIEPRIKGAFSIKFKRATEWRLNDRRCDVTGEQSQAFLKWQPEKSISRWGNSPPNGREIPHTRNFGEASERWGKSPHTVRQTTVGKFPTLLYLPLSVI
jgi:DNA-binding transcriptional regulator YhcF (GntR family)